MVLTPVSTDPPRLRAVLRVQRERLPPPSRRAPQQHQGVNVGSSDLQVIFIGAVWSALGKLAMFFR